MVEVTYHCPYCGALTSLERDAYLDDKSVTKEPLEGWAYAPTTGDYEEADGVEFVCIGDADPARDGCGRTFYLNFVKFEEGREIEPPGISLEEDPNFDFLR